MKIINGALFVIFCLVQNVIGETVYLENVSLKKHNSSFRITIECTSSTSQVNLFKVNPPRFILYLRDTKIRTPAREWRFADGPVKKIEVTQWKTTPRVAKVTIYLLKELPYEFSFDSTGHFFVDISTGDKPASNSSTNHNHTGTLSHAPIEFSRDRENLPDPLKSNDLISLDVHEAEIGNVLRMLAKLSKLNIIASKEVSGKITVSLSNVTIKDALENIVRANGYDYVVDGEVILVKPVEKFQLVDLQTKIFRLRYVNADNLKSILKPVLSLQGKIQVFYQDFKPEQKKTAQPQAAQFALSRNRSSTLIVTDSPEILRQIERMIQALDVPTPQIMIEAKLIEVSPQNQEKLGINWSKTLNAELFGEETLPSGSPRRFSVEVPLEGGGIRYGTLSFAQFNAVLDFLSSHTNAKLVSNPRILAMDNQEAVISVGTNVPIPQITRGVGGQGDIVTFEYRDVNVSLRVTPHVSDDSTITMLVNPVIEEITGEVVAGENRAPITSKREVQTVVKVKSNDTIVIGGLIKENTIERVDKVWFLGDVPLIGNFFRHKDATAQQTDLLIFITPRIVQQ